MFGNDMWHKPFSTYRRIYLASEWADSVKRMAAIEEARETARAQRPAIVDVYVKERANMKGIRVVRVIAHR